MFNRSANQLQERYCQNIDLMDTKSFDLVVTYLKEQGSEGYLVFGKNIVGETQLINIQHETPRTSRSRSEQCGTKSLQKLGFIKPLVGEEQLSNNFKKMVMPAARGVIQSNQRLLSTTLFKSIPGMEEIQKSVNMSLQYANQTCYKIQTDFQGIRKASQPKYFELKELNSVINMLVYQYNKTREQIIDDLQDVDGNIQTLIQVYSNPIEKSYLKWTKEDDQILKKCQTKEEIAFKLLIRYRGEDAVKKRIIFKKVALPFEF